MHPFFLSLLNEIGNDRDHDHHKDNDRRSVSSLSLFKRMLIEKICDGFYRADGTAAFVNDHVGQIKELQRTDNAGLNDEEQSR